MALSETAAPDPEKGEMNFIWLDQWQNHHFLFLQGGRRAIKRSPQR